MSNSKKPQVKMRKIELRQFVQSGSVVIASGEQRKTPESLNYIQHIRALCQMPKNGQRANNQETREVTPILDQLDDAEIGDALYLTESQWADVKHRSEHLGGQFNMRSTVVFEDDIKAAPEVDMREEEEKNKAPVDTDSSDASAEDAST